VKVSNRKGIANQTGRESCVVHREVRGEALTGERAGGGARAPSCHANEPNWIPRRRAWDCFNLSSRLNAIRFTGHHLLDNLSDCF
jgi:hypothetical protein